MSSEISTSSDLLSRPDWLHRFCREYKAEQGRFAGWLAWKTNHPKARGFHNGRRSIYLLSTRELLLMAHSVSEPSQAHVPIWVVRSIEFVLERRRRCAEYYSTHVVSEDEMASNRSHQYMIRVLENILRILLPLAAHPAISQSPLAVPETSKRPNVMEEYDESADLGELLDRESQPTSNLQEVPATQVETLEQEDNHLRFQIDDPDDEQDKIFRCFALLDDLSKYRRRIQQEWTDYEECKKHLDSAAQVTQRALDFARHVVDDFQKSVNEEDGSYEGYLVPFLHQVVGSEWLRSEENQVLYGLEGRGWKEDSHNEIMDWGLLRAWQALNCAQDHLKTNPRQKPQPSMSTDESFSFPKNHESEICMKGCSTDCKIVQEYIRVAATHFDEVPGDDASGEEGPVGEASRDEISENEVIRIPRWTDGISEELQQLDARDRIFPLYAVFAAQVLLDIQNILSDQGLSRCASEVFSILDHTDSAQQANLEIADRINFSKQNEFLEDRAATFELIRQACRNTTQRYAFARNPIQVGLAYLEIVLHFNDWGTLFADKSGQPFRTIHIYNAAIQEGAIDVQWPDLDFVIGMHTPEYLFMGGFPRFCDDYCTRMRAAGGLRAITNGPFDQSRVRRLSMQLTKLAHLLRVCNHSGPDARNVRAEGLDLVVAVMKKYGRQTRKLKMDNGAKGAYVNMADLWKLFPRSLVLEPSSSLDDLGKAVDELLPILHFDYAGLSCCCFQLEEDFATVPDPPLFGLVETTKTTESETEKRNASFFSIAEDLSMLSTIAPNLRRPQSFALHKAAAMMKYHIGQQGDLHLDSVMRNVPNFELKTVDFGSVYAQNSKGSRGRRGLAPAAEQGSLVSRDSKSIMTGATANDDNETNERRTTEVDGSNDQQGTVNGRPVSNAKTGSKKTKGKKKKKNKKK